MGVWNNNKEVYLNMVNFIGEVVDTSVSENTQTTKFRVPAFTRRGARTKAMGNARFKGLNSPLIKNVEIEQKTPRFSQNKYIVSIISDR